MPVSKKDAEALTTPRTADARVASAYGATVCTMCGKPPVLCGCKTFSTQLPSEAGKCQHEGVEFTRAWRTHLSTTVVSFRCKMCPWKGEVIVPDTAY